MFFFSRFIIVFHTWFCSRFQHMALFSSNVISVVIHIHIHIPYIHFLRFTEQIHNWMSVAAIYAASNLNKSIKFTTKKKNIEKYRKGRNENTYMHANLNVCVQRWMKECDNHANGNANKEQCHHVTQNETTMIVLSILFFLFLSSRSSNSNRVIGDFSISYCLMTWNDFVIASA